MSGVMRAAALLLLAMIAAAPAQDAPLALA